ncbi:MAG: phosphoribosylglycinamide formyltransferase [Candidatus Altiarchaeota archaeon]|nr:phosphoribosylglycinamide formyltransferase [Candidatus Altiarchaeota archaeon]
MALRIGVLASGRGSNLQAIIDAVERNELSAVIAVIVSNNKGAQALERARGHGIKASFVNPKDFPSREEYEREVVGILKENGVNLVVLAGYMLIAGRPLLDAFKKRIINIHPALLPSFPGLHAQRQAIMYGVKFSGCTVHFVDEHLDGGPIILQSVVPVLDGDDEESLSQRILVEEHKLLVSVLKLLSEDKVKVSGRIVRIL